jgi:hypothetical protein
LGDVDESMDDADAAALDAAEESYRAKTSVSVVFRQPPLTILLTTIKLTSDAHLALLRSRRRSMDDADAAALDAAEESYRAKTSTAVGQSSTPAPEKRKMRITCEFYRRQENGERWLTEDNRYMEIMNLCVLGSFPRRHRAPQRPRRPCSHPHRPTHSFHSSYLAQRC